MCLARNIGYMYSFTTAPFSERYRNLHASWIYPSKVIVLFTRGSMKAYRDHIYNLCSAYIAAMG